MKPKIVTLPVGAGLAVIAAAAPADALSIAELIAASPNFQLEDDSAEIQNVDSDGNRLLDVGDTIRGIIEFPQLRDLDSFEEIQLDPAAGNSHVSAVFEIEAATKTQVDGGDSPGDPSDDRFFFTFAPHAQFATGLGLQAGAMVAFYEDEIDNTVFTGPGCTTASPGGDCESGVTDGTLVLQLGITGADADETWVGIDMPEDLTLARTLPATTVVGNFIFQLGVLESSIGQFAENQGTLFPMPGGNNLVSWLGSGSLLGTAELDTPYDVSDDADLQANAVVSVPEPATLGLMGAGLAAIAGLARRRRRAAA